MSNAGYRPLIIESIIKQTKDFKTFVFREGHDISYEAGQFITLIDKTGLQEIRRSYSITSSPVLKEPLSIAVKRIDNGFFSRKLIDRTRVGDELLTTGAAGFFRLPENINSYTGIFFFAAGSGIAPILSLIKTVIHLYPEISVFLIYSNQSVETTAFYRELKRLESEHPKQLRIDFLYSSESDLRRARLNREFLLEFLTINLFDREKTLFYVCGPESYMRMIIFLLGEEGFPINNIKKEDFNPANKKLAGRMPPDKNTHLVQLDLKGTKYNFPVQYPDSILQAARKIKLTLDYSCETGKCGSCAAICISGKVWMSNNEVLTDQDLAKGLTLTCTGHPQNGDVWLKIP
jgi:ring-1,2-phenylacetyl-CoA epoxidase subunit PaaE